MLRLLQERLGSGDQYLAVKQEMPAGAAHLSPQHGGPDAGQVFNVGGGVENSLSLLELLTMLEQELSIELKYTQLPWRASDQRVFISDSTKAKNLFGFNPLVDKTTGIRRMIEWVKSQ